jgi:hypothetical protein
MLLFILTGCSSVRIFSDYDRSADFKIYKSYAWLQNPDTIHDLYYNNPLMEKNLKNYVNKEMAVRGYIIDIHHPDLLIEYHTEVEKKQQIVNNPVYSNSTYPYYMPYMYNNPVYRYGYYNSPRIIGYNSQVIDYNEGTLVIDVIDRKQNQLVWRGWSVDTVYDAQILEGQLPKDIKKIFKRYPVTAPKKEIKFFPIF